MNFYSGFCFKDEASLFSAYIDSSIYCVSGFSLGAIKAFLHVLEDPSRIDKLQLFSPAFFLDKTSKYKRAQLHYFQKDKDAYINVFMQNVAYPSQKDLHVYQQSDCRQESLAFLLDFLWPEKDLRSIVNRGIEIEVYLGGRDKIINATAAREYFLPYSTVYFIKEGGHSLHGQD